MPAFVDTGLNIAHVDDVATGHLLAYEKGELGQRYILGGENLSLAGILASVAMLRRRRPLRICLPRWPLVPLAFAAESWARATGGPAPMLTLDRLRMAAKPMYFSHRKAQQQLSYRSRLSELAICDAVEWFEREGYLDRRRDKQVG